MDHSPPTTTTVRIHGIDTQVERRGAGETTILLLHGSDGGDSLADLQQALSREARCLLPRHPGFGGTAAPVWLDNVADLANFYLELIEREGLKKVHLVGVDLGGWIAAEMAVRHSAALASLTLVSALGIHVKDVPVVDVFLRTDEQLIGDTFHSQALAERLAQAPRSGEQDEIAIKNKEVTARLTWQPRGHDPHLAKWLHRIGVPTLVVWGAQDRILPPAYGEAWAAQVPGAKLVTLADCGHAPQIEKPVELASAIEQFTSSARSLA
ncbi:alpha/beta fold hydrolase [Variovorax sp. M-6]|uniref:alpha/beta fold hydrolase n=1 Tax=Variovorax sp. M-6 TaxID=3233041 RepID=UPI003F950A83